MRILIVDDEPGIRESLAELLEEEGYAVAMAKDGGEAISFLESGTPPCMVLLDLIMPVMDGNEVYARMQADARLHKVPVVITTSDPSRAPSGTVVMKKPINVSRLLSVLETHCATCN